MQATKDRAPQDWRASAAYLYVLHLDTSRLAWEYLRRNSLYRQTWQDAGDSVNRWGLELSIDPSRDAREAPPLWSNTKSGVSLIADTNEAPAFPFWSLLGEKSLSADAHGLRLTVRHSDRTTRLNLHPSFRLDHPYGFLIAAGPGCNTRCRAVQELTADYGNKIYPQGRRPTSSALNHMRMLQTLDGIASGAPHRDIAEVLFGLAWTSDRWTADGELRARIRYWVRRAQTLSAGGYLRLLDSEP